MAALFVWREMSYIH
ncbi:hypothetical protein MTR67_007260 [Solanum verrucosum]|uniref:Uncharacterized protein n=1 Tax=Solanum verrucosum TaxID=315347 RepID=A0AAF0Q313_SOLVR|nr:hypothetical protein MTR67_007260 [Solanum verrucosum]